VITSNQVVDLLQFYWDIDIRTPQAAKESAIALINHRDDNLKLRKREQYDSAIDMLIGMGQCDTNNFSEARLLFIELVTNLVTQHHTGAIDVPNAYLAALGDEELRVGVKHTVKTGEKEMSTKNNENKAVSKMSQCRVIFARHAKRKDGIDRQTVLGEFQEKAGLTLKGAATYYNSIKHELQEGAIDEKGRPVA